MAIVVGDWKEGSPAEEKRKFTSGPSRQPASRLFADCVTQRASECRIQSVSRPGWLDCASVDRAHLACADMRPTSCRDGLESTSRAVHGTQRFESRIIPSFHARPVRWETASCCVCAPFQRAPVSRRWRRTRFLGRFTAARQPPRRPRSR
jgi:hypothetical protein